MGEISKFNQKEFYFEKLKPRKDFQIGTKYQPAIANGVASLSTLASLYALNNLNATSSLVEIASTAGLVALAGSMFLVAMGYKFNQLFALSKKAGLEAEYDKILDNLEKENIKEPIQVKSSMEKEGGIFK